MIMDSRARRVIEKVPIDKKVNLTQREASELFNLGINTVGKLMRVSKCPYVLKVGRKRLIIRDEFEKYLKANPIINL